MARGGERKGAGRKSTWKSGCKFEDTKLIRVPSAIAAKVLDIAHKLDAKELLDLETNSNPPCPRCGAVRVSKDGHHKGKQRYECTACQKKFLEFS